MSIRPFTNKEWEDLPHVILTADTDWNPTVINHELDSQEEWFNTMHQPPDPIQDSLFDKMGDYKHAYQVASAIMDSNLVEDHVITSYPATCTATLQQQHCPK